MKRFVVIFRSINGQYEFVKKKRLRHSTFKWKSHNYLIDLKQISYRHKHKIYHFIVEDELGNLQIKKHDTLESISYKLQSSALSIETVDRILKNKLLNDIAKDMISLDWVGKMLYFAAGGVICSLITFIILKEFI